MGWSVPLTHRQFLLCQSWLDEQDNQPSRSDHYAMQIACEIARTRAKYPNNVKLDGFKLVFTKQKVEKKRGKSLTKEGKATITEQMWIGRMSAPITVKKEGEPDKIILPPKLQAQENIKKQQQVIRDKKKKRDKPQPPSSNFPIPNRRGRIVKRGNDTGTRGTSSTNDGKV